MKQSPVRVYLRGQRFYVRYQAAGKHDISTGILADITEPASIAEHPDWWRASKHAEEIESFVRNAGILRTAALQKRQKDKQKAKKLEYLKLYGLSEEPFPNLPPAPASLETIAEEYIRSVELKRKRGKLAPGTIDRRHNALRMLRKFDHGYSYERIDRAWLERFRDWAEKNFRGSTLVGYLTDLRAIAEYGISEGTLTGKNKFREINFAAVYRPARKTPWQDEERIYRFLYAENPALFEQVVFQRLTGFRVTWVCDIKAKEIDLETEIITSLNRKAGRVEDYPIIKPLRWLLTHLTGPYGEFAFKYRNRSAVYSNLQRACKYAGASGFGTHQLKKNNASEWRRETGDPDVIAFLSHHASRGVTKVSREVYVDPEEIMDAARMTLDRAQTKRWTAFFRSLKNVKPSGQTYRWSNEKGDWKYRKNIKVTSTS